MLAQVTGVVVPATRETGIELPAAASAWPAPSVAGIWGKSQWTGALGVRVRVHVSFCLSNE